MQRPQPKPFYRRTHPCPECCGNVAWRARKCPHCEYVLTASDRYDLAPPGAQAGLFAAVLLGTAVTLYLLLAVVGLF
jgi:hypothetical protein